MPTLFHTLQHARATLQNVSKTPTLDAELLLSHCLQKPRSFLHSHADTALSADTQQQFNALLQRRAAHEPIAYLLGEWGFWSLDLAVTTDTLIPRPETELLVEQALQRIPSNEHTAVADLGTGSGAIALAIASERPQAQIIATDQSAAALHIAQQNAHKNAITNVTFIASDWFTALSGHRFAMLVSNPPYIATNDPHLNQLTFEPHSALASGPDGLDDIRQITAQAPAYLTPGGWLLLEHGYDQAAAIQALFTQHGFQQISTVQDLEQRDRVTLGRTSD